MKQWRDISQTLARRLDYGAVSTPDWGSCEQFQRAAWRLRDCPGDFPTM